MTQINGSMAILEILEFPDPRLRTKAKPVTDFGDELQQQIVDLASKAPETFFGGKNTDIEGAGGKFWTTPGGID